MTTVRCLFVVACTPDHLMTPVRRKLREIMESQLAIMQDGKWRAWFLGERSASSGPVKFIACQEKTKGEKLRAWLPRAVQEVAPQYVVRLDDDDLINPNLVDIIEAHGDFDCLVDGEHWFFDLVTGKLSTQPRNWFANTVVHKTEHAMAPLAGLEENVPVLAGDHSSEWHKFYSDKNVQYADPENPLYIRVLSPTSVTAGAANDEQWQKYAHYRSGFGQWNAKPPGGFEGAVNSLHLFARQHYGEADQKLFKPERNWKKFLRRGFK